MIFSKFKKAVFCSLSCAALFAACGTALAADKLTVATDGTFAPFEFHDSKTNDLIGFELDLVKAMGEKMGVEIVFHEFKFDAILPAVATSTIDFAASGFAVTEERAKRVLFTDPFYMSGLTIIVPKGNPGNIKDFDDLKGKRISVQLGSISHDRAKQIPDAELTTFEGPADALLNMMSGNADAVINAVAATDYMLVTRPALSRSVDRLDIVTNPSKMAMVVPKTNPDLQAKLNEALKAIRDDGTYNKIHMKWFGRPAQ